MSAVFSHKLFARYRRDVSGGFRITTGGIVFVLATCVIGVASIDADINLLLLIFGICLGALVLNVFYGWRTLRALSVKRVAPDVVIAGQAFFVRYLVTNRHRWSCARNILIEDVQGHTSRIPSPEAFVPVLRPGETLSFSVPFASASRGRLVFSRIRLSTRFPFHLFVKWTDRQLRHEIIVFPRLGRLLIEIKPRARSSDATGGMSGGGHLKGDEEFYGVREYRAGDNPRRIHWRRSARTGQLMVREMSQAHSHQLWCAVNTRIDPGDAAQAQSLELAISAAATVICDALERGARIGLVCNGEPLVVLPPGSGLDYRPKLLRELAIRPSNTDDDLAPHIDRLSWPARWHGPCYLFGAVNNEAMRAAARAISSAIGPATVCVPGEQQFEHLFQPDAHGVLSGQQTAVNIPETSNATLVAAESIR